MSARHSGESSDEYNSGSINVANLKVSEDISKLLGELENNDLPSIIRQAYVEKIQTMSSSMSRKFRKIVDVSKEAQDAEAMKKKEKAALENGMANIKEGASREQLESDLKTMHKIVNQLTGNLGIADSKARLVTQQWQKDKTELKEAIMKRDEQLDDMKRQYESLETRFRTAEQLHRDIYMVSIARGGAAVGSGVNEDGEPLSEADILRKSLMECKQELETKRQDWLDISDKMQAATADISKKRLKLVTCESEIVGLNSTKASLTEQVAKLKASEIELQSKLQTAEVKVIESKAAASGSSEDLRKAHADFMAKTDEWQRKIADLESKAPVVDEQEIFDLKSKLQKKSQEFENMRKDHNKVLKSVYVNIYFFACNMLVSCTYFPII